MITINGSIAGIFIVILIPIFIHIKCIYFDKKCGNIEGELIENPDSEYNCHYTYSHKVTKYFELIFFAIVVGLGFKTMVTSII